MPVPVGDARTRPGAAFAPVLVGVDANRTRGGAFWGCSGATTAGGRADHGDGYVLITYQVG